ncbi:MAG: type I restriction enzyme HsdR N-terminal domain-containing protein [Bacteroidetes bacterium]|nr:MAG: type I restriction enzyme HsdR N-terminal domain-containing protein [Bacteroidota bacterium]
MIEIDFEAYFPRLKFAKRGGKNCVFDPVRRRYVAAEKEELVRQVLLLHFTEGLHYPKAKMAVEKMITVNGLKRRFDVLVYDPDTKPFLLVECKAPDVKITEAVFRQIAAYNLPLKVPYLLVTNGVVSYCCRMDYGEEDFNFVEALPEYPK